ncbi:aminotransferase class I/II-fold pyridoxal phosphate-dependent enzyme [Roseomonas sp. GC11]|uniref:aminotransferase class I/II-fold pyridoxal phosphate-dependent enzyme n=1 Tax=Roseomonas sp. GC11 TaxID=2950546 RepID=UPI00210A4E14|nr:aminotransferase class I/II-fold pyridoxal phosphate-dependent enzyme [Roseomonas sp. GC11]MCQ4161716.1 aminotransferase class I/II-fold pyridoxal phosphate-dependent enzyme [Roseomonas sp. GC11]
MRPYDLTNNYPVTAGQDSALRAALAEVCRGAMPGSLWPAAGDAAHRRAIAGLLGEERELALVSDGMAGMGLALSLAQAAAQTQTGRAGVALEEFSFPLARRVLALAPLHALAMDGEGPLPAALEALMRQPDAPGVLYLMPRIHNPLGFSYSPARRAALAEIIRHHDLWVVEDAAYAFLDSGPGLAPLLPERVLVAWSLAKPFSLALQLGALGYPAALAEAVEEAILLRGLTGNPVMAAALAHMAESGAAAALIAEKRAEGLARRALAADILGAPEGPAWHLWLPRPAGESALAFQARWRAAGLLLPLPTDFHHTGAETPFFRLSLGGEPDRARLSEALTRLKAGSGGTLSPQRGPGGGAP